MKKHHLHIVLPWPNKALAPNVRCHWAIKYRASKAAHRTAHFETFHKMEGCRAAPVGKIDVRLSFYPPDKRRRDEDNMIASMKHYLDGIAHGLRVDDRNFHLLEPFIGEPVDGGCVHADLFGKGEH